MPRRPTSIAWASRALGLLGALLLAVPAAAQSQISVPDGCGSEGEFHSEIERLTGVPAASAPEVRLVIGPVGAPSAEFELQLEMGAERRVLRDPACRVLWRSALVIVAAASRGDPEPAASAPSEAVIEPAPPPPSTPSAPAPSAAPSAAPVPVTPSSAAAAPAAAAPPPSPAPVRRAPRRAVPGGARSMAPAAGAGARRSVPSTSPRDAGEPSVEASRSAGPARLGIGLGVGVSSGVVPGWAPQLEASAQLELSPWALALSLRYWPERDEGREGRSVLVAAWGGRAAALFRLAPALNVLGGLELNRLDGEGAARVRGPGSDVVWQLAPVLGLSMITMDTGHLRLELGALARLPLVRPRFEVTGFGTLYRAPPIGADVILRGVFVFW